nr:uncharacterized protein LOC109410054 [Aedes albopictus]
MDRITHRFLIFQGLSIGILSIVSSLVTIYNYAFNYLHYETWERHNDINGMPEMIIPVRKLCWLVAAGALLYGIHRRQIRFFYPIIGVAALVLLIHLVRELLLLWTGPAEWYWHFTLFCNPSLMLPMIGRRIHGMMTLVALRRLFESDHSSDNNFVRFNPDREECETNEMN